MTLLLSCVSHGVVLHAADRLTSRSGTPYDTESNKTLVYRAKDAVVVVSYTGVAYLGGRPTDQWIAEQLSGQVFGQYPSLGAVMAMGIRRDFVQIGNSLHRLAKALDDIEWRRTDEKRSFQIEIVGWQQSKKNLKRKTLWPFHASINIISIDDRFRVSWSPRRLKYRTYYWVPGGYLDSSHSATLKSELSATNSEDECETVFVKTIRSVAQRYTTVGPNCMTALIYGAKARTVRIRFFASQVHEVPWGPVGYASSKIIRPAQYVPWILSPSGIHAPSVTNTNKTIRIGDITVELDSPGFSGPHLPIYFRGQPRKGPP